MSDIFEYAMQMELDGKAFYEKSAAATAQPELKKILLQLAQEEDGHYRFFKRMKEGQTDVAAEVSADRPAMLTSKNLFQQMTLNGAQKPFGEDAKSVWSHALKIEEKAVKTYSEEAAKERDTARKRLLELIADEERTHVYLIDNILSYMVDPKGFVDSANYRNFMSWEGR
jgi:rubrerythrin